MLNWSPTSSTTPIVVNTLSKSALLSEIERNLASRRGFSVATLNLDHVVKLRADPAFCMAYERHSHVVADGNPIVWLARLAGQPAELVPGSEMVEPIAGVAARLQVPIALVGSTEAALKRAEDVLVARYPGLDVASRISPPMGFDPEGAAADAAIEELGRSGARLCFLALGAPRQEIFAIRAQEKLPEMGFLSIGAGLDFLAGTQVRAPMWVRALAAEWIWRLATNPMRFTGRYAACLSILPALTGTALAARRRL